MNALAKSCMSCSVCWTGGVARHPRILSINSHAHVPNAPILVIDDMPHDPTIDDWDGAEVEYAEHYWERISATRQYLNQVTQGVPYVYTQAVRCETRVVDDNPINPVVACAVWTHNLTDNRALIMTGQHGFKQIGMTKAWMRHTLLRDPRLGYIYTIGPVHHWVEGGHFTTIEANMQRILKERKLI